MNTQPWTPPIADASKPRRFIFVLLDRFTMLSFAGAIEPLRMANRIAGRPLYDWRLVGRGRRRSTCSNGGARSGWTAASTPSSPGATTW